jgi:hypothetical protein
MFDEQNFETLSRKINAVLDQYDNGSRAERVPTVRRRQTIDAHD